MRDTFPFFKQLDAMDCGPSCLRMICKYYGRHFTLEHLRELCDISRAGVSLLGISAAAEQLHFRSHGVRITFEQLCKAPLPCIVHWQQSHFVVVYGIRKRRGRVLVDVADPATGKVTYSAEEFCRNWCSTRRQQRDEGIVLLLESTPDFYNLEEDIKDKDKLSFLFHYLRPYRKMIVQLFLGMFIGTILQLLFPFLMQSLVDYGIGSRRVDFVILILIAQLTLNLAETAVEFLRSWLLLFMSTRINISIISDFLSKLMKLPIRFFDTKMLGDIMQRIGDHNRIESFLTSSTLNTIFSFITFIVFSIVLAIYQFKLFVIFLISSTIYILWITLFLRKRRALDFKRFDQASKEQSNLYQLITGMQEIKLCNCERQKRWKWEEIQARLFKISVKSLVLSQYQQSGAFFINESKNIIISICAALSVINGDITLGMMTAIQYIIGQLNSPINQIIAFIQSAQDAKISLERLNEIHRRKDEISDQEHYIDTIKENSITISGLNFRYNETGRDILRDITIEIPPGKVTAIVGTSGSGKTTLIKMLLGFYPPRSGEIKIGTTPLPRLHLQHWRDCCGTVMQDGFIFSDTIANNIAVGVEKIDYERLDHATQVAHIQEMVDQLPLGYNTVIGQEGKGISQGQRQRILIARAVYKNPDFLFFDEATNALDANNEKIIMKNLQQFFQGKTVVVVAHRLSTVRNADQIIVLNQGAISEIGTHEQLVQYKGEYYELIKNQLEIAE